ncbi:hypothetical protein PRIC1_006570 [Phytophthora ramorum]
MTSTNSPNDGHEKPRDHVTTEHIKTRDQVAAEHDKTRDQMIAEHTKSRAAGDDMTARMPPKRMDIRRMIQDLENLNGKEKVDSSSELLEQ